MPPASRRLIADAAAHRDMDFQVDRAMERQSPTIRAALRPAEEAVIRSVYRTVLGRVAAGANPPKRAHEEERE